MKKYFTIFYIILVSVFFYCQNTMDICRLHTYICTDACVENIIDHSTQIEDSSHEDKITKVCNASYTIPSTEFVSSIIVPLTIPGIRPFIWQPPEV